MASEEEIRMYIREDKFHMVKCEDLEKELERLDEKHRRYMIVNNEETMRIVKKIITVTKPTIPTALFAMAHGNKNAISKSNRMNKIATR